MEVQQWAFGMNSWILMLSLSVLKLVVQKKANLHAAPLTNSSKIGILHGAAQYVIQDKEGQIGTTESISAGLDYPGISPLHCFLKDTKRARYTSASDEDALKLTN